MVKVSAFINNFEQEAGNALTLLSNLETTFYNQNFSNIQIKNSSMNNCQFFFCDFNNSKLNNVSIVSIKFIECKIQNANWMNLESSQLQIYKCGQSIFSGNNSVIITFFGGFQICFINLFTRKQLRFIVREQFPFKQGLQLSCQGQVLVLNDLNKILFWSIQLQKLIRNINKNNYDYNNILSPDCQIFANVVEEESIILWKIYSNPQILEIKAGGFFRFSKNCEILIARDFNKFWKVFNGEELEIIECQNKTTRYKFSPNGKYIAIFKDKILSVKEITNQPQTPKVLKELETQQKLKFSPDGNILACSTYGSIFIWNITHQQYFETSHQVFLNVKQMQFSPNIDTLAFYHQDKIVFWKYGLGNQFHILRDQMHGKFAFSKNGQYLISQREDSANLWSFQNLQKYSNLKQTQVDDVQNYSIVFSPQSDKVGFICGSSIKMIKMQDLKIHKEIYSDQQQTKIFVLSPDFKQFLSCSYNGQIQIKKIQNNEVITQKKFEGTIEIVQFSPDGQRLAIGSSERTKKGIFGIIYSLKVWRIEDWKEIFCCTKEVNFPRFKFSINSQFFATGSINNLSVIKLQSKELIGEFVVKGYEFKVFTFSQNEQYLAFVDQNDRIIIWRIDEGTIIQTLNNCLKNVRQIEFLDEETNIVSANQNGSICLWNVKSGQIIQVLDAYESDIIDLTVTLDESMIAVQYLKGIIYFWTLNCNQNKQTKNKLQENESTICQVKQFDEPDHNPIKEKYQFSLYYIMDIPSFRAKKCSIQDSEFSSKEGMNLQNVFAQDQSEQIEEE